MNEGFGAVIDKKSNRISEKTNFFLFKFSLYTKKNYICREVVKLPVRIV